MDEFKRAVSKTIGPGGLKCPCCNIFRTFGCHRKKKKGLSKLARSRLKQKLTSLLMDML